MLKAAQIVYEEGVASPSLLGRKDVIKELMQTQFETTLKSSTPNWMSKRNSEMCMRKNIGSAGRGTGLPFWCQALDAGTQLLCSNDGKFGRYRYPCVSGYASFLSYRGTARFGNHRKFDGVDKVATTNLMLTGRGPLFIRTPPSTSTLQPRIGQHCWMTNYTVRCLVWIRSLPWFRMLILVSSKDPQAAKVKEAVSLLHHSNPDMIVDGEIQADFALNATMLKTSFLFPNWPGQRSMLVFQTWMPAAIIKCWRTEGDRIHRSYPCWDMKKPVHIFQLGASVEEMVNMTAIAVVDVTKRSTKR